MRCVIGGECHSSSGDPAVGNGVLSSSIYLVRESNANRRARFTMKRKTATAFDCETRVDYR